MAAKHLLHILIKKLNYLNSNDNLKTNLKAQLKS